MWSLWLRASVMDLFPKLFALNGALPTLKSTAWKIRNILASTGILCNGQNPISTMKYVLCMKIGLKWRESCGGYRLEAILRVTKVLSFSSELVLIRIDPLAVAAGVYRSYVPMISLYSIFRFISYFYSIEPQIRKPFIVKLHRLSDGEVQMYQTRQSCGLQN